MGKRKEATSRAKPAPGKKAKKRTMQERAGLDISPGRCHRILDNTWRGGKISREAEVVMAALLQYFAQVAMERATTLAGQSPATCSELQRAIKEMGWPEQSGLLRVHIIGAALGEGEI